MTAAEPGGAKRLQGPLETAPTEMGHVGNSSVKMVSRDPGSSSDEAPSLSTTSTRRGDP